MIFTSKKKKKSAWMSVCSMCIDVDGKGMTFRKDFQEAQNSLLVVCRDCPQLSEVF